MLLAFRSSTEHGHMTSGGDVLGDVVPFVLQYLTLSNERHRDQRAQCFRRRVRPESRVFEYLYFGIKIVSPLAFFGSLINYVGTFFDQGSYRFGSDEPTVQNSPTRFPRLAGGGFQQVLGSERYWLGSCHGLHLVAFK